MADKAFHFQFGPILSGASPMSGFQIFHYAPGTNTDKTAWTGYDKSATVSQPLQADVRGLVNMFGDGLYRLVGVDANSVVLYDFDNVQIGPLPQGIPISVHKNGTDQASLSDATWIKVTWSTEVFDEADTFTGNRWTPGRVGRALIHGRVGWVSAAANANLRTAVYVNSVLVKQDTVALASTIVSGIHGAAITAIVDIVSTSDVIEIYAYQDTGGEIGIEGDADITYFMGALVA